MKELKGWRLKAHKIIFEAETPAGKIFDIALLVLILFSILVVMLESIEDIQSQYGSVLRLFDWIITILFTIEYVLRIICVRKPRKYIFSFFGMIDFLSIIPTYLDLFIQGSHYFKVLRVVRLLRIFRVLKLADFQGEAVGINKALRASIPKITVFIGGVLTLVVIIGALFYLIEGKENGFTSIPASIYWAIVTLTTVGYGDITPGTPLGRVLSAFVMIIGYGIIAVPTGIVSVELSRGNNQVTSLACDDCGESGHDEDATYCKFCGGKI